MVKWPNKYIPKTLSKHKKPFISAPERARAILSVCLNHLAMKSRGLNIRYHLGRHTRDVRQIRDVRHLRDVRHRRRNVQNTYM